MKRKFLLLLCVVTLAISIAAQDQPAEVPPRPPQKHQVVTAAQANGVYRYFKSEFRILALGHNKLKVQFDGVYMTLANSPNIGYASGQATIDGNIATFKPADTEHCEITLI